MLLRSNAPIINSEDIDVHLIKKYTNNMDVLIDQQKEIGMNNTDIDPNSTKSDTGPMDEVNQQKDIEQIFTQLLAKALKNYTAQQKSSSTESTEALKEENRKKELELLDRIVRIEERAIRLEERAIRTEERIVVLEKQVVALKEQVVRIEERIAVLEKQIILIAERVVLIEERVVRIEERIVVLEERTIRLEEGQKQILQSIKDLIHQIDKRFEAVDTRFKTMYWILGMLILLASSSFGVVITILFRIATT